MPSCGDCWNNPQMTINVPLNRWVVLTAAVLVTAVPVAAGPAAAQADRPDPARALKRQLKNEHGVRTSETARVIFSKKSEGGFRIKGSVQLGSSGAVATDFTWRDIPKPGAEKAASHRVIRVGKDVYYDSGQDSGAIPDGKTWTRRNLSAGLTRYIAPTASLQPFNVYDPSMLKAVLTRSTTTPVSGGFLYRGTISYKELSKISTGGYINRFTGTPVNKKSKGTISWRLWADRGGLLKRLYTTDALGAGKDPAIMRVDTRYTGWGFHLVIAAPPADEVMD
ncbi:hypothetical protein ACQP1V_01365 [Microtetraspora malaysiensis]|uniref:hypothetical protein n=1 Tax=Microtetraspora malaysiensis TaxID=161358 RepID=UPI003D89DC2D